MSRLTTRREALRAGAAAGCTMSNCAASAPLDLATDGTRALKVLARG